MRLVSGIVFALLAVPVLAANVVNTSAPAVNYVFSDGSVVLDTDRTEEIFDGGVIQSRYFQAEPGSPAAGKWVYEYRIDLTNATSPTGPPFVTSIDIWNGPMRQYDYNFDSVSTDDVYVITSGGLGSVGLASVTPVSPGLSRFTFSVPVSAGQSSYFFGFISDYSAHSVGVFVNTGEGSVSIPAWTPADPCPGGC